MNHCRACLWRGQLKTHVNRRRYGITDAFTILYLCPGHTFCPPPSPSSSSLNIDNQPTMLCFIALVSLLFAIFPLASYAQSSCTQLSPSGGIRPSIASGYQMQVVATGLSSPRGILLDGAGNLLAVEQDRGVVSSHRIAEDHGCVTLEDATDLTRNIGVSCTSFRTAFAHPRTAQPWNRDVSRRRHPLCINTH